MMLKKTKGKSRLEELNAQLTQEEMDMQYRHRQEEMAMDQHEAEHGAEHGAEHEGGSTGEVDKIGAVAGDNPNEDEGKDSAERRIAKAQRKRVLDTVLLLLLIGLQATVVSLTCLRTFSVCNNCVRTKKQQRMQNGSG